MNLSRRGFLGSLIGAAAWQFMPTGPMCWPAASSVLVTPEWMLKETARAYVRSLAFSTNVSRRYDDAFRVGDTVRARTPNY